VTIELRRLGHEAYSCDIEPCSGGHPEWHIQQDVLPLLDGRCGFKTVDGAQHALDGTWDMIIAFPPCTYLTNAGARHLWKGHVLNEERYQRGLEAKDFFMRFLNADCPKVAVENPTPSRIFNLPPSTQTIQPWQFGHPYTKRTNLWLRNIPPSSPQTLWSRSGHGAQVGPTQGDTTRSIKGCLLLTGRRTGPKHFRA
jgi:hypothetical protein